MKRIGRLVLIAAIAILVVLGLGYAWGVSGRSSLQTSLDDARQRLDMAEARALVLDARVSLYNNNFGDASRRFEDAKDPLRRIRQRYVDAGNTDSVRSLSAAIEHLEEAQRLAGKLDPAANSKAGEALEAVRGRDRRIAEPLRSLEDRGADLDGDLAIRQRIRRLRNDQRLAGFEQHDHPLIQRRPAGIVGDSNSSPPGPFTLLAAPVAGCTRGRAST